MLRLAARATELPLLLLLLVVSVLAVLAGAQLKATPQVISWQQSKGQVDCSTDPKYLCGRVQSVHDGDSIRVRPDGSGSSGSVRVRLIQVDAPELAQPYGPAAQAALAERLPTGSRVCVVSPGRDLYRRLLGVVCQMGAPGDGGSDVNAWLLAGGHAWCYLNRCCPAYAAASQAAKSAGRGLWSQQQPQPPWLYRRRQRRLLRRRHHGQQQQQRKL